MSIEVRIIDGPLDAGTAIWEVPGAGAILCFDGVVRPLEDGQPIAGLHYQAYEPMASNLLRQLADETKRRFGVLAVRVEHSRGDVPVGRCAFRLQLASAHRTEALAAMTWFIDRLKQDVPIWKSVLPLAMP
jgi:molybdopterin synthase catalytic subunit